MQSVLPTDIVTAYMFAQKLLLFNNFESMTTDVAFDADSWTSWNIPFEKSHSSGLEGFFQNFRIRSREIERDCKPLQVFY